MSITSFEDWQLGERENMLTIFAIPKAFQGPFDIIQRNAIRSWTMLRPTCEVILLGNDEGVAEAAEYLGVRHVPSIACNDSGTPLVSDAFRIAQQIANHNLLAYVNADIILMSDWLRAILQIKKHPFLMVGHRWDLDIDELLAFDANWEQELRHRAITDGARHGHAGIDYFVFTRGLFNDMPSFAVGRSGWDNWTLYHARRRRIPLIDATACALAVHQNHDFSHHPGGFLGAHTGSEAQQNIEMAGGVFHLYDLRDVTWLLTSTGCKAALQPEYLLQRLRRLTVMNPLLRIWIRQVRRRFFPAKR